MKIRDLSLDAHIVVAGDADRDVTGINHDSRVTGPHDLYAALPGANVHGAQFFSQLYESGVRAVLTDQAGLDLIVSQGIPTAEVTVLLVDNPRAYLGAIAAQIYGTTAEHPRLYGVTGTNGKTTTTFIIDALLARLGETTGLIGTVSTVIANNRVDSLRTTPEAPELHQLFARMRKAGVGACTMEVSSHALAQHRVDGACFSVVGFTNLSQDHLDFHATMDEYFVAKAKLFTPQFAQRGVIVLADDWARRLVSTAAIPVATVSRQLSDAPTYLVTEHGDHYRLVFTSATLAEQTEIEFRSPLAGEFNITNTALALAMLVESGISPAVLNQIARSFSVVVPGRMETVSEAAPRAIVDYSHTPDALEKVLSSLSGEPLVVVVGAGGDRDPGKRPLMGAAAARWADAVIVTDDNPRSEDPSVIRNAVLRGVTTAIASGQARAVRYENIANRKDAIALALELAGQSGTVLIAGKGHETGQEIAGVKHHFDDREETRNALLKLNLGVQTGKVQD